MKFNIAAPLAGILNRTRSKVIEAKVSDAIAKNSTMKSLGHLHLLELAIDAGVPYPDATHEICLAADVLFGAVGHPNTIMTQPLQTA
jgi:3-isopropylmalate dehydrogenase